jgi:S1-C subfamily serine protease
VQDISDDLAAYFGITSGHGVLVSDVAQNATVALERGDVILAIDGDEIRDVRGVEGKLSARSAGTGVDLAIERSGEPLHVTLTTD